MLIDIPTSLITIQGRTATIDSLPDVGFVVRFENPQLERHVLEPLSPDDTNAISAWLTNHSEATATSTAQDFVAQRWRSVAGAVKTVPVRDTPAVRPTVNLATLKAGAVSRTDFRSDKLISAGFTVGGKVFSASDAAQLKWLGMYTSRAQLTYPISVPTQDDSEFVTLNDDTDVAVYYTALLTRIQTVLVGGVALKTQIAAAADEAALTAIVDNRT